MANFSSGTLLYSKSKLRRKGDLAQVRNRSGYGWKEVFVICYVSRRAPENGNYASN